MTKRYDNLIDILIDILMALGIIAIAVLMWSWASNIAPKMFLNTQSKYIDCADCPYDDLARCEICVEIFNERMPD